MRLAGSEEERAALWKGRKTAFGAVAQIAPDYYLHDTVVPRAQLADILEQIYEITDRHEVTVMNVFHAGDGNLHPLLVFDAREEGTLERVHAAGAEILRASLAAGGVLSGEHGIGSRSRPIWTNSSPRPTSTTRTVFARPSTPPVGRTPARSCRWVTVAPTSRRCAKCPPGCGDEHAHLRRPALHEFAALVGADDPIAVEGNRTRWHLGGPLDESARLVKAPTGIVDYQPSEMVVTVRAGTTVAELHETLAAAGQTSALPDRGGTVGGAVAVGENRLDRLGRGSARDAVCRSGTCRPKAKSSPAVDRS